MKLAEIAQRAFDTCDQLIGELTGGIEAPRIITGTECNDDGSVTIRWRNPETCGLSDVRYHNTDISEHEDVFMLNGGELMIKGKTIQLADIGQEWPEYDHRIKEFLKGYGLEKVIVLC